MVFLYIITYIFTVSADIFFIGYEFFIQWGDFMFIRTNTIGLNAHRNWTKHNNRIATALQRLSSGKRINSAADDAAGLSISQKMRAQLSILNADKINVSNNISKIEVADGALSEVGSMLNHMLELANESANGTLTELDRENLDKTYQELLKEINRTAASTTFNTQHLFGGSGNSSAASSASSSAAEFGEIAEGKVIELSSSDLNVYLDSLDTFLSDISLAARNEDSEALMSLGIDRSNGKSDSENLKSAVINFTRDTAETLSLSKNNMSSDNGITYTLTITGGDISIGMPSLSDKSLGLESTNIKTQDDAQNAIDALQKAIKKNASWRGDMGAAYNRLQHTMNSLDNMEVNLTDALSRIEDCDMAKEMMIYAKEQLLAQAAMFAMVHARQEPEQVISLLKSL